MASLQPLNFTISKPALSQNYVPFQPILKCCSSSTSSSLSQNHGFFLKPLHAQPQLILKCCSSSSSSSSAHLSSHDLDQLTGFENGQLPSSSIEVDSVTEAELKENGFRSTRRTKLVCTIGPATCGFEELEALAEGGMNVARLNMCHGTHEWHKRVIERVRKLNEEKGFAVAIMMDTEGSEIHMGDLGGASSAKAEV